MKKIITLIALSVLAQQIEAARIIRIINDSKEDAKFKSNVWWDKVKVTIDDQTKEYGQKEFEIPEKTTAETDIYIGWREKSGSVIDESLKGKIGNNKIKIQEHSVWGEYSPLEKGAIVTISGTIGGVLGLGTGVLAGTGIGALIAGAGKRLQYRFIRLEQSLDELGKTHPEDKIGIRDKIFADNEDEFIVYISDKGLVTLISAAELKAKKANEKELAEKEESEIKKAKEKITAETKKLAENIEEE